MRHPDLGKAEWKKSQDRGPARKRLGNILHKQEVLRPGQNETPTPWIVINDLLQVGEQLGYALDLIENDRIPVVGKKTRGSSDA